MAIENVNMHCIGLNLQDFLVKRVDTKVYKALIMAFSAQTNCNQTQDIIMGKLDKRRKGEFMIP